MLAVIKKFALHASKANFLEDGRGAKGCLGTFEMYGQEGWSSGLRIREAARQPGCPAWKRQYGDLRRNGGDEWKRI